MLKIGYPRFKIHSMVELLMTQLMRQYVIRERHSNNGNELANEGDDIEDEYMTQKFACYVFPTLHVAKRFQSFMESGADATSEISFMSAQFERVTSVFFPKSLSSKAKAYWQHTGEVVSSRLAMDVLKNMGSSMTNSVPSVTPLFSCTGVTRYCKSDELLKSLEVGSEQWEQTCELASKTVKERILSVLEEPYKENCIHLVPSGMAAIFSALRLSKALAESGLDSTGARMTRIVVFGFPYLDTLKMMQRSEFNQGGVIFLGSGGAKDEELLLQLLTEQQELGEGGVPRIAAVFTEVPSNPLIKVPNLRFLSEMAKMHDFLLVVDDTLGSFACLDLLRAPGVTVDILCSSLTKVFSGRGDVLAGSLVINSRGTHASRLRQLAGTLEFAPLYGPDAVVLENNSRDYVARCHQIGKTASQLASWLQQQTGVERVYYPGVSTASEIDAERFDSLRRTQEGESSSVLSRGYLFSIVLAGEASEQSEDLKDIKTQIFFDALSCWKGPSLGTNFTLSCLYTLLAHYSELEWAKSFGVDHRLVRVSVGLEDISDLKKNFSSALWATKRPGLWLLLKRLLVRVKGMPLPALVTIISFLPQ